MQFLFDESDEKGANPIFLADEFAEPVLANDPFSETGNTTQFGILNDDSPQPGEEFSSSTTDWTASRSNEDCQFGELYLSEHTRHVPWEFVTDAASSRLGWALAVVLLTFIAAGIGWKNLGATSGTDNSIHLSGKSVAHLKRGAKVVWGDLTIGHVQSVETDGINPRATLDIHPQFRNRLPASARMEVGSLNPILPGNVGVRVIAYEKTSEPALGNEVQARTGILPAQTPVGFWLVVAMAVLMGVVGFAVALKVLCIRIFWKALAAFLLTLAIHLCCRTVGSIDTVRQWSVNAQEMLENNLDKVKLFPGSGGE